MGAADFTTVITVKGTKEECLEVMKVLRHYANDRKKQYREKHDCWYLDVTIGDPEKEVDTCWKSGEMSLGLSGPYGVWYGLLEDDCDLFQRIADTAPTCYFRGSISGFDPGSKQSLDAELKDGRLFLSFDYKPFGEDLQENEEDDDSEGIWGRFYDPKTKSFSSYTKYSGPLPMIPLVVTIWADPDSDYFDSAYFDYVADILSYEKFKKLFEFDSDDYENYYYDSIEELFGERKLFELSLSEFTEIFPVKIDEESFKNAVERIKELGIKSREEFEDEYFDTLVSE
ncbi:MAG: hypothetical protein IKD89_07195 [Clostridia bacterium]|nr:hypothetical protein [Clostridia bacterium]